jgi:hypothetical protein
LLSSQRRKSCWNVSARAFVQSGDNVLIAGFIVGGSSLLNNLLVIRAIGPSLSQAGVANPLPDPTLEVRDASGAIIASNDNWQDTQELKSRPPGWPPTDPLESVILTRLPAGGYTAIVRSADDTPASLWPKSITRSRRRFFSSKS